LQAAANDWLLPVFQRLVRRILKLSGSISLIGGNTSGQFRQLI